MAHIPHVKISLTKDNVQEIARKVIEAVRPGWDFSEADVSIAAAGFLNVVVMCYKDEKKNPSDAIVIKSCDEIFCGKFESWKQAVQFLTEHQLGPEVLAFLDNGCCMRLVHGETFGYGTKRALDADFRDKVAEELARWHCQKVLLDAKKSGVRKADVFSCDVRNYWDNIFTHGEFRLVKDKFPTKQQYLDAVESYEKILLDNGDLDEAFVHLDANSSNIILNVDNGKGISLVDFDFIGLNYAQNELAYYFRLMYELTSPGSDHLPGKEYETTFLRHYLKHRNALDGKPEPTDIDVERLYRQVQKAKVLVHLKILACTTSLLFYKNEPNRAQSTVEGGLDGGMEKFIAVSIKYWEEFEQYKNRVLREYA